MHGLDRASPPSAAKAREMLDEIGGSWWNVYIGGPRASVRWTPADMRGYVDQGITRFLLTYVGRQQDDVPLLTTEQGRADGDDACRLAATFGHGGAGTPLCLDLELLTFEASPRGSLDYACGWTAAVQAKGLRPGVYANVRPLKKLAERADRPDWVWVAKWIRHRVDHGLDQHRIDGFGDSLWSAAGQRAWQYAGAFDGDPCRVGGLDVDINAADSSCLVGTGSAPGAALKGINPSLLEDDDMFTFGSPNKPVFFVAGGKAVGLNEATDLDAIRASMGGVPLPHLNLDGETFNEFIRVFRDS